MKINFTKLPSIPLRQLMRRCGYAEKVTRLGKISFVRRIHNGEEFPRFHAYTTQTKDDFQINLHLDQKSACYGSVTAHSGEYDGTVVESESDRLKNAINSNMVSNVFRGLQKKSDNNSDSNGGDKQSPPSFRFG